MMGNDLVSLEKSSVRDAEACREALPYVLQVVTEREEAAVLQTEQLKVFEYVAFRNGLRTEKADPSVTAIAEAETAAALESVFPWHNLRRWMTFGMDEKAAQLQVTCAPMPILLVRKLLCKDLQSVSRLSRHRQFQKNQISTLRSVAKFVRLLNPLLLLYKETVSPKSVKLTSTAPCPRSCSFLLHNEASDAACMPLRQGANCICPYCRSWQPSPLGLGFSTSFWGRGAWGSRMGHPCIRVGGEPWPRN